MATVFVGNRISCECKNNIEKMGYRTVLLPDYPRLSAPVCSHADMIMFFDGKRLIMPKDYYEKNRELFAEVDGELCLREENISDRYPFDIAFNAILTNDGVLFSKTEYTSEAIKSAAFRYVKVNQGYTACSTCRVADKAFITADEGLYKAYVENGIDCLKISQGAIALPGCNYGFIGGASVVLGEKICFFGDIKEHPDYLAVRDFAKKYGKETVSLSDEKLTDIGGAVIV